MKKQQINHLAEFRANKEIEKKEAEHQTFIENMENKSYKQLSIAQLNYLYEHHKPIYDNLTADREYIIRDLAIIDKLKRRTKQSAEEIEAKAKASIEAEQSGNNKRLEQLLDEALTESLKRHKLL